MRMARGGKFEFLSEGNDYVYTTSKGNVHRGNLADAIEIVFGLPRYFGKGDFEGAFAHTAAPALLFLRYAGFIERISKRGERPVRYVRVDRQGA